VSRDQEFSEYAGARWRHLVHAAILLGCSVEEAEDLAQATLLRCYTSWPKVAGAAHRDAYVTKVLLNAFRASRRRRWWRERARARGR
jgi:DNA-directed RNA polymerase specialized sigma24 family protein